MAAGIKSEVSVILNFHGLGEAARPFEDGEAPYWLPTDRFCAILDMIERRGQSVQITFDDGNGSDYEIAVPELRKRGLQASFFVLAGKLDTQGYLTSQQVREMDADPLFTIGSHGMMHRPWPECAPAELDHEIGEARKTLADICGREIADVALPFGRYNRAVLSQLKAHGHQLIYSSDGMAKLTSALPIPRFSPRSDTPLEKIEHMIAEPPNWLAKLRNELRVAVKSRL